MTFHFQLSMIWLSFGILSFLVGRLLQRSEPKGASAFFNLFVPKWATHVLGMTKDPYSVILQIGGFVLILLSLPVGTIRNLSGLQGMIWISLLLYCIIPGWFIRSWRKEK